MLRIGETLDIDGIPEGFSNPKFEIDITGADKLMDWALSPQSRDVDIIDEKERIEKKSAGFFLAMTYNRMKTFLRLVESTKILEDRMIDKAKGEEISAGALVSMHEQFLKRMDMEMKLYKADELKEDFQGQKIFNVTNDNRVVNVGGNGQKQLGGGSKEFDDLSPESRKNIQMLTAKLKNV